MEQNHEFHTRSIWGGGYGKSAKSLAAGIGHGYTQKFGREFAAGLSMVEFPGE
jgi:hypothetical protein